MNSDDLSNQTSWYRLQNCRVDHLDTVRSGWSGGICYTTKHLCTSLRS